MKNIILILLIFISFKITATVYYVSPTGDDSNSGTITQPWKTWGYVFNSASLVAGDTVYFRGGVYYKDIDNELAGHFSTDGTGYTIDNSGTSSDYIYYLAYPGETPILDDNNVTPSGTLHYGLREACQYCYFKGLTVRNVWSINEGVSAIAWKNSYGYNNIYDNCTAYNVHGIGFECSEGNEVYYINCDAYDCCDSLALAPQLPGNRGSGFSSVNLVSYDKKVYFQKCRAWDCGDQGFVSGSYSCAEFDSCWSFRNGMLEGAGMGFKIGYWGTSNPTNLKRRIVNCIAAYNRDNGISTNDGGKTHAPQMEIFNNTVYYNGYAPPEYLYGGFGIYVYNTLDSETDELQRQFRNNISYNNELGEIYVGSGASYTHSNNSWDTDVTITDADFVSVDSTGLSGARQADGSLPVINFLKLVEESDLIDVGVNVGLDYNGFAPDLGWFESGSGGSTTPIPPTDSILITSSTMLVDSMGINRLVGDTLWLKANSFAGDIDLNLTGNPSYHCKIFAHPDFTPVFSGSIIISGDYLDIKDIQFTGGISLTGEVQTLDSCTINSTLNLNGCIAPAITNNTFTITGTAIIITFPNSDYKGRHFTIDNNTYNISPTTLFNGLNRSEWRMRYDKFDQNSIFNINQ